MAHLFISHSTRDGGAIALQLAASLEAAGHRCWIAPRDVKPGVPYPGQIVTAIESCSGLVLVVTPAANESPDVLQEIQTANTARKVIAPVVVNATAPGPDMRYYIGVRHQIPWTDARATTAELLRSFPAVSSWTPSLATAAPADPNDRVDLFMIAHGDNKISVIKVVKEYCNLGLAEAKTLVEGFPPVRVAYRMPRSRALAMHKDLKDLGATMADLAITGQPPAMQASPASTTSSDASEKPAHALLRRLGLSIVAGETTAYPKAEPGPAYGYRYWATYLRKRRVIQFGAEYIAGPLPRDVLSRLEAQGYVARPNLNEAVIELPDDLDLAVPRAQERLQQLRSLIGR